ITIHAYHVLSYKENILRVMVQCSKGTYIRALARDLGNELGCGAFVKSLRRLSIGAYFVENSSDVLNMAERIKQALATSTDKS
ncbi:MAG TPA: tRNA pseudouridine(55) synthase TruB, partial [bacterium]|nr:tRNA pseudouridine(55) synthase TruB [bacterium]